MHIKKTKLIFCLTLGLVFYLLIFSSFALFHAYANNELNDAHGCQIGLWVQHSHDALGVIIVLAVAPLVLLYFVPFSLSVPYARTLTPLFARAPPVFPSL